MVAIMADFADRLHELYPLSLSQQNIWALERAYPETSVNNICTTIRIQGRVDFVALQKSLLTVLAADSSLRMRITLQGKTPLQYCVPYREESFSVFDFSQTSAEGSKTGTAVTREPMPILTLPCTLRAVSAPARRRRRADKDPPHHFGRLVTGAALQPYRPDLPGPAAGSEPESVEYPDYGARAGGAGYLRSAAYDREDYWEEMLAARENPPC
jgi:hypothetical protein